MGMLIVPIMEEETLKVVKIEDKLDLQGNNQRYVSSNFYDNHILIWHSSSIHDEKRMQNLPNLDSFIFEFQTKYMVRGIHDEFTMNIVEFDVSTFECDKVPLNYNDSYCVIDDSLFGKNTNLSFDNPLCELEIPLDFDDIVELDEFDPSVPPWKDQTTILFVVELWKMVSLSIISYQYEGNFHTIYPFELSTKIPQVEIFHSIKKKTILYT